MSRSQHQAGSDSRDASTPPASSTFQSPLAKPRVSVLVDNVDFMLGTQDVSSKQGAAQFADTLFGTSMGSLYTIASSVALASHTFEGEMAGYLKAVWPDLFGAHF